MLSVSAGAGVARYNCVLDPATPGGERGTIEVDWAGSAFPNSTPAQVKEKICSLVLFADRSTQDRCPNTLPDFKGLFSAATTACPTCSDRIFVNDNYLAWFDVSKGDGISYAPKYGDNYHRAGALAGYWTLYRVNDASGQPTYFWPKYNRSDSAAGAPYNCFWARNELIPGSASPDQQRFMWDKAAFPVEHELTVFSPDWVPPTCPEKDDFRIMFETGWEMAEPGVQSLSQWSKSPGRWGYQDASGDVHYETSSRMVGQWSEYDPNPGPPPCDVPCKCQVAVHYTTDVVDGMPTHLLSGDNEVANYIDSKVDYACGLNGIKVTWRFSPALRDVTISNSFVYYWLAYVLDNDSAVEDPPPPQPCDGRLQGDPRWADPDDWPDPNFGLPLCDPNGMHRGCGFPRYSQSSLSVKATFPPDPSPYWGPLSASTVPVSQLYERDLDLAPVMDYGPWASGMLVNHLVPQPCPPHSSKRVQTTPEFAVANGSWIRVGEHNQLSISWGTGKPRWQFLSLGIPGTGSGTADSPLPYRWELLENQLEDHDGTILTGMYRLPDRKRENITLTAGTWYSASYLLSTGEGPLVPSALLVDSAGNGVLEPGETAVVTPFWQSARTAQASANGSLSAFQGPAGAVYSVVDSSAGYGTVSLPAQPGDPDRTVDCQSATSNCYRVQVSAPSGRPATHWDATFTETLSTGDSKVWTVHIGGTFADVPIVNNPYYPAIERLIHSGVTLGCDATNYCPNGSVNRAQMAMFIARAMAGADRNVPVEGLVPVSESPGPGGTVMETNDPYSCMPGGISRFNDVSPTDMWCRHVHYLLARGVTGGYPDGGFHPGETTPRAQEAMFLARAMKSIEKGGLPVLGGATTLDTLVPSFTEPSSPGAEYYDCRPGSSHLHYGDVSPTDMYCKHVHFLWLNGIPDAAACSGGSPTFCPAVAMSRSSMATFLVGAFNLEAYRP